MGQDRDSAAKFLARFAEVWATNDGRAVADLFTEDGTLINPFGQRADGRDAVGTMYTEYFAGMLAGTSTSVRVDGIRPVGETHAFVDAEQTVTAGTGEVLLVVHLAALLARDGEDWRFVDSRPYTLADPPA